MKNARVCQRCKLRDTHVDDMKFEMVGKKNPVRKFYHKECFKNHLADKEFKKIESEKLDSLKEAIEDIYNLKTLPHQAYPFLQRLRNGEDVLRNQRTGKRYKEGYDYSIIEEAFRYCEDDIKYWSKNKTFNGFVNEFMYGLTIVVDKIYIVERMIQSREQNKLKIQNHLEDVSDNEVYESSYKKRKEDEVDLSDFLE